jgi:hypothetical protein
MIAEVDMAADIPDTIRLIKPSRTGDTPVGFAVVIIYYLLANAAVDTTAEAPTKADL